jgi:Outer membrane protein beta-barrel domain
MTRTSIIATVLLCLVCALAEAQSRQQIFTGVAVGIATLAADARSEIASGGADVSLYKPENGPALNVFAGSHFHDYLTAQANYVWNRNDVTLTSVRATESGPSFYEAPRASSQHAFVGDLLLYFRERRSAIRPYLSAGVGVVRFQTTARGDSRVRNATVPPANSVATHALLRVTVGLDVSLGGQWSARYSFSESVSGNPISVQLSPPGQRNLANFQNLFGVVRAF